MKRRAFAAEVEVARLTALLETTREGLGEIERMAGAAGYGETPAEPIARKARFLLLAASSPPPGDRMLVSVNHASNPTDIVGKSAICPDCGNALLIATVPGDTEGEQA